MNISENEKIYGNNYADFFVEYYGIPSLLDQYKDAVRVVNFFTAVVYLPVSEMSSDSLAKANYSIPALYGLTNDISLEASGIIKLRNMPTFNLRGKGVLIGFADTGIDYTNPVFQNTDKTTRIAALWDQTIESDPKSVNVPYGTEYSSEMINRALMSGDSYQIVPSKDEIGHGTMVAGIAAGNEIPEKGFYGVAPDSELIMVKLKPAKAYLKEYYRIPENQICFQENDLLFALQYLLNYASYVNKPIVLCITCDTSRYSRDGKDLLSSWLSLQASYPGIAALVPAGNEGRARRHFHGVINETPGYDTVELNIPQNETGLTMGLWGSSPNIFTLDIISPSGEYIPKIIVKLNETQEVRFIFESTIIYIHYQIVEPDTGDQMIFLRFINPAKGIWKFNVYGKGLFPMDFNIWLPMNDFVLPDTYFIRSDPDTTLLSLSCSTIPITVTAYNAADNTLFTQAGLGYTRNNMVKPDIAAPGVNILSPSINQEFIRVTGTSAAVAHAAGVAAMLMEWGEVEGKYRNMSTQDIKVFMTRGARRETDDVYPNKNWGYGILDIFNVFESLKKG